MSIGGKEKKLNNQNSYTYDKRSIVMLFACVAVLLALTVAFFVVAGTVSKVEGTPNVKEQDTEKVNDNKTPSTPASKVDDYPFAVHSTKDHMPKLGDKTVIIPDEDIYSEFAILVDAESGQAIASRKATEKIYPASMTKMMTLAVVVDNLKNTESLKDVITVSESTQKEMERLHSSGVGLKAGYSLTVEEMLYALMLYSDGAAATELAIYTAGSTEMFVALMNQKAKSIGMQNSNFTNCTGLHDDNLYSTCRDIAALLSYCMENDLCKKIMSSASYGRVKLGDTEVMFWHQYLILKDDKVGKYAFPKSGSVIAGKTGLTDEAGYCLATYYEKGGKGYICVTAKDMNPGSTVHVKYVDHKTIYENYVK